MSTPGTPPSASERLAAIEALDDIVVGVDRDLRITSWNDAAERLLDRPAGVALGGALLTMITPGMRIAVTHLLDRALKGETIKRQPVTFIRRDGSEVVMSTAIAPIVSAEGRPSGLVVLGHDLGEQPRLQ
jgi:PAS domain S-box-containing protein